MGTARPFALSIAGYDPSGGAGLLADIKTFENCKVYGLGVQSALTWQNEMEFSEIRWESTDSILQQMNLLGKMHRVRFIKVGLIRDIEALETLLEQAGQLWPGVKVIWDPILSASAGFEFHKAFNPAVLQRVLKKIYIVTPNIPESVILSGIPDAIEAARELARHCVVYLKGGHSASGKDYVFRGKDFFVLRRMAAPAWPKHGSGCIFSAAFTAQLARGFKLHPAALRAKSYIHRYLSSSNSLLGYHKR
ncbi:MAG: hydroxymethylpyrimidine/phosphomethylpyrimidine kinase [Bacteroidia bacterium]|nr:hydroxymethylpyrimidine/phosphomethylpyrimidine kinase [Bacteroidia bacterium]